MVPDTINRYAFSGLGTNFAEATASLSRIKSSFGLAGKTPPGKILSHIAKCLSMGLSASMVTNPLFRDGTYLGCILYSRQGDKLIISGKTHLAAQVGSFAGTLQQASPEGIYAAMKGIIPGLPDYGDAVITPRTLNARLMTTGVPSVVRPDIEKLFAAYTSKFPFLSVNVASICTTFSLIASDEDIPDDLPMHKSAMCTDDRILSILSAFGSRAPSFLLTGGKKHQLNDVDYVPISLAAIRVSLDAAATDIRTMASRHYILVPTQGATGKLQKSVFKSQDKSEIYGMLVGRFGRPRNNQAMPAEQVQAHKVDEEWDI
jgi:hypothetical protein